METCEEGLELRLDGGGHFGIGDQLHVLQFVLLSDCDVGAVRNELLGLDLSEVVAVICESQFQVVLYGRVI